MTVIVNYQKQDELEEKVSFTINEKFAISKQDHSNFKNEIEKAFDELYRTIQKYRI